MVALGKLCTFINGGTPSKSEARYFEGEIPWITSADIVGPVVDSARSFITEEAIRTSATNRVPAGTTLLVTRTGVGKVATAGLDLCFGQDITAVIPDSARLDSAYLVQFLKTKQSFLLAEARGATIKGVTRDVVAGLEIPLPPLPQQHRIAAILDQADALRAKRREALAQLDRLTQAIFVEMFGDPVSNPKGWPVVKLGEVGTLDRGVSKHRPRNDPKLLGGAYPLIQTGDVANCDSYIDTYGSTYSDFGLKQSKLWPAGTLCITIAANIAKTGILKIDACFPDSVVGFRAESEATVEYVRVWLSFLQKMLEDAAPESAQKNINLAILRDLDVPLPPTAEQEAFYAVLSKQNAVRANLVAGQADLDGLFTSLQHRAFRGEL